MTEETKAAPESGKSDSSGTGGKTKKTAGRPKSSFCVCAGKSITTKVGIKDAGEVVTAEILGGGEDAFQKLVDDKVLVKG